MLNDKRIAAIVPAAGKGERMGGKIAKQFLEINGKPVLIHTLEKLSSMPEVDLIVVAAGEGEIDAVKAMIVTYRLQKIKDVVVGGGHRQDSVWNCLRHLTESEADIVLVHDAVRPFISRELVIAVCNAAIEWNAAILVVRPKDTLKTL